MSVLSSKRVAEAEAAETRGRMQQLARPVVLVRAAVPRAKTAGIAARDGARYGAIHPTDVSGIQTRVRGTVSAIDPSSLTIGVTYPDGDSLPTERIQVSVSYPLTTFWPGPHAGTYGTSSTMRIEKQ